MKRSNRDQIVIIGNGGAAINAIKALRGAGFKGSIHQVSDTDNAAFNPMLAPYFLKGMISWEHCFPYGPNFYKDHDVSCIFGTSVEHIDTLNKTVFLGGGRRLFYDKCLVASGARVVIPPIPGLKDSPYALPLRTPESTIAMQKIMTTAKKVVVLGASLVGVKVAEILSMRHIKVILLDAASQLLPRGAHPITSSLLKTYYENHGIDIRLGCSIEGLEGGKDGVCCFFPEAIMEEADFVAVCAGIRPNCTFLDKEEVDIDQAVLVDKHMQTSVPDLYAAGDVSQGNNLITGKKEWLGTWNNACCQGRIAGLNMAGQPTSYEGCVPQHISPFYDWVYAQIGDVDRKGSSVCVKNEGNPSDKGGYRLCVYENNVLVGANLINQMQNISSVKKAIVLKKNWPLPPPLHGW